MEGRLEGDEKVRPGARCSMGYTLDQIAVKDKTIQPTNHPTIQPSNQPIKQSINQASKQANTNKPARFN
jgi:hypothetical protein